MISWYVIPPDQQIVLWRHVQLNGCARDNWLPGSLFVRDSLKEYKTNNEPMNSETASIYMDAEAIWQGSARKVDQALDATFKRHRFQAAQYILLHGVHRTYKNLAQQAILLSGGIQPDEVEGMVKARLVDLVCGMR